MEDTSIKYTEVSTCESELDPKVLLDNTSILIADYLSKIIVSNSKNIAGSESNCTFNSKSVPKISILNYYRRILRYIDLSESTLYFSLIYVDAICARNNINISFYNIHRYYYY